MFFLIFVANMSIFVVAVAPITYSAAFVVLVFGHGLIIVALTTAQGLLGIAVAVQYACWRLPFHASLLPFQLFLTHIPAGFFPSFRNSTASFPLFLFFFATFSPVFSLFLFCAFPKASTAKFRTSLAACLS